MDAHGHKIRTIVVLTMLAAAMVLAIVIEERLDVKAQFEANDAMHRELEMRAAKTELQLGAVIENQAGIVDALRRIEAELDAHDALVRARRVEP
jgi:hypothetical protein